MSPINLGQLPSNEPAPTGLCQIKRGAANTSIAYDNMAPANTRLMDGNYQPMRIAITPSRPGWWLIRAETIWLLSEAVWYYGHWGVRLTPADALGFSDDRNHMCIHSALGWSESIINTAFRLNAGVAYYVDMNWPSATNGGTWSCFCGPDYFYIAGEFIEDGAL